MITADSAVPAIRQGFPVGHAFPLGPGRAGRRCQARPARPRRPRRRRLAALHLCRRHRPVTRGLPRAGTRANSWPPARRRSAASRPRMRTPTPSSMSAPCSSRATATSRSTSCRRSCCRARAGFGLIDYDKTFCPDPDAEDIFDLRGIDRDGLRRRRPPRPVRRPRAPAARARGARRLLRRNPDRRRLNRRHPALSRRLRTSRPQRSQRVAESCERSFRRGARVRRRARRAPIDDQTPIRLRVMAPSGHREQSAAVDVDPDHDPAVSSGRRAPGARVSLVRPAASARRSTA